MKPQLFSTVALAILAATVSAQNPDANGPVAWGSTTSTSSSTSTTRSSSSNVNGRSTSSSSSSTTRTLPDGSSETTVTTVRDGVVNTRLVKISPTGEVTLSEQAGGGGAADPAGPGHKPSRKPADADQPGDGGGWLGVNVTEVTGVIRAQLDIPEGRGVVVSAVAPDSPAKKAGLEANDILLELDRQPIEGVEKFRGQLHHAKPGQRVDLAYIRRGKQQNAQATLAQPPDRPAGASSGGASSTTSRRRTTVVDADGTRKVIDGLDPAVDPFKQLLNDPNVPEDMKKQLRRTQKEFRKVQPPGIPHEPEAPAKDSGTI